MIECIKIFFDSARPSFLSGSEEDSYPEHRFVKAGFIHNCQVCHSEKLHTILDLGHQPLCDSLLNKEMLNEPEKNYPLRMIWCENCTVSQIDYRVDGKEVYHPLIPIEVA